MNSFSDFDIQPKAKPFSGDKIDVNRILNVEIIIEDYKIVPSKYKDDCLHLQIVYKNEQRVVFNGSKYLIDMIRQVSKEKLPFKTTIVSDNKALLFK